MFCFCLVFGRVDPFTSTEAVDDSIPNLNPFLTKPVVDPVHLPVVSSDAVSFSSRTSSHEMFGGKRLFFFSHVVHCLLSFTCCVLVCFPSTLIFILNAPSHQVYRDLLGSDPI